jgi:uncharacterized YigZ family protein
MLFSDSFYTIKLPAEGLLRDRGSKFLAYAYPVKTESEIKDRLQALKKEHPSASHHCYAWRLGADKLAYRANDDGEPSNTAGKPILSQIQSKDLTNVLIVVIRYFGGTLLGVNGLINAYKSAAEDALAKSEIVEQFIFYRYKVEFDFDAMSAVMRVLKEFETKMLSNSYDTMNTIVFEVKKQHSEKLEEKFKELYTTKLEFINMV